MYELASTPPSTKLRHNVLVVIEQSTIRDLVAANLCHAGYLSITAGSLTEGLRLAADVRPDLIVIDADTAAASDAFGERAFSADIGAAVIPTVVLTGNPNRWRGAQGPLCGASVCVVKPFSSGELLDCIQRQLRSIALETGSRIDAAVLRSGALALNLQRHTASTHLDGRFFTVDLTVIEMNVLRCLMTNPERIHSREQIRTATWGPAAEIDVRTVDQCIARLRVALRTIQADAVIRTVRGFGYRLDELGQHELARSFEPGCS